MFCLYTLKSQELFQNMTSLTDFLHRFTRQQFLRSKFIFLSLFLIPFILASCGESETDKSLRRAEEFHKEDKKRAVDALKVTTPPLPEKSKVYAVAYLPDDSAIVSAVTNDEQGRIVVWNSQSGAQQSEFSLPTRFDRAVFSPDAKLFAFAGDSLAGRILIWSVSENKSVGEISLAPEERAVSLNFSSDSKRFAAAVTKEPYKGEGTPFRYNNFSVKIWDAPDWKLKITTPSAKWGGHIVSFSPDGNLIASNSDKYTTIWDIETGKIIESLEGSESLITAVAFNPYDQSLITGDYQGRTRQQNRQTKKWEFLHPGSLHTNSIVFSENGLWAASAHELGSVQLFFRSKDYADKSKKIMRVGQQFEVERSGSVNCIAFSHNGKYLDAGIDGGYGNNASIKVWEVETSIRWSNEVE